MKRVILESPYAGDVDRNLRYLRACLRDSLTEEQLRTAIKLGIEVISKRRSPPPRALIRHMYEALGEDAPAPRRPTPHEMLEAHRAEVKRRQERAAAKALRMARRNARA